MSCRVLWTLCLVPALFGGCGAGSQLGTKLERADDLFPSNGDWPVTLKLANVEIRADASIKSEGLKRAYVIRRNGSTIEAEEYEVSTERISVVSLGLGEKFEPPLDLLRFPMTVGERIDWAGRLVAGGRPIPSKAVVSTEAARLEMATGPTETVHVTVQLEMADGSPKPARRKLEFWFAKGKGPVKRDFGNQVREPRLP